MALVSPILSSLFLNVSFIYKYSFSAAGSVPVAGSLTETATPASLPAKSTAGVKPVPRPSQVLINI